MASSEVNPASLAEARSIMRSRATLFGSTGDAELARELRAAETTARAAEYTARAIMRSRANITSLDDEITARQMQAPDHSPAMAHLLAIARRDLAALEQERNNMMMRSKLLADMDRRIAYRSGRGIYHLLLSKLPKKKNQHYYKQRLLRIWKS